MRERIRAAAAETGGPIRLLVGKPGLDGHSNGAEQIAVAARDAGLEVVYQGIRLTPAQIAQAAQDEDVDVVGLSILSGAHLEIFPRVTAELKARGIDDVLLFCGGIIPEADIPAIKEMGFQAVFGPGTDTNEIIAFLREHAPERD